jgi:hypothetical protein
MSEPDGPSIEEDLRWDTTSTVTVNMHTPWDVLRAQLLWSIWCRRVELAFRDDPFHLGAVLWHAWRNTVYCAMEAYRELFRHKRNEEKRQELISCFQQVWTQGHIFGRLTNGDIHWNITPPAAFLPEDLGAWNATPIRIQRLSPSPDLDAEFVARPDFNRLVDDFLQEAANNWQPAHNSPQPSEADPPEQEGASTSNSSHDSPHRQVLREQAIHLGSQGPRDLGEQGADTSSLPSTSRGLQVDHGLHSDKENLPPNQLGEKKKSRPKRRCLRAYNHPSRRLIPLFWISLTRSEGELRQENLSYPENEQPYRGRHVRRPKVKCFFGPRAKQRPCPFNTEAIDTDPTAPSSFLELDLTEEPQGAPLLYDLPPLPPARHFKADRVTFTHPHRARRSPFDHYKASCAPAPGPDPFLFAARRLGVSVESLNASVTQEIDDLLSEIEASRRRDLLENPVERLLTKEDCLQMFRNGDLSPSGSLAGVFRWASSLDTNDQPDACE